MSPDDTSGKLVSARIPAQAGNLPLEGMNTVQTGKVWENEEASSIPESQESSETSESSGSMDETGVFHMKTERKESLGSNTSRTVASSFSHHISSSSSSSCSGSEDGVDDERDNGDNGAKDPAGIRYIHSPGKYEQEAAQLSRETQAGSAQAEVSRSISMVGVKDNDNGHRVLKEVEKDSSTGDQWLQENPENVTKVCRQNFEGEEPKLCKQEESSTLQMGGQLENHRGPGSDEACKSPSDLDGTQTFPFEDNTEENEAKSSDEARQVVSFDPSSSASPVSNVSHKRRSSANRSDLSSTSQHLVPFKQLDPEEEERRRHEVDTAMEILEHMRRANLVMEFGPGVDFDACIFCLREERKQNMAAGVSSSKATPKKKKKEPFHNVLPNWKPRKECLICHTPVCKQHWDSGFLHQQNVILCQDCAPLFDLDNLVECMNFTNRNKTSNRSSNTPESQKAQKEQHMRQLLLVYDRALLALRHSSQSFDDQARRQMVQTSWHKEGLGIGSCVSNIASGVTGLAATAVFMTPMGPWLLLTSLALGGFATAIGSGSFLVERLCPQTRQAEQTIALASMVDSLLEATAILREAKIAGALPPGTCHDDSETSEIWDEDDDMDASICGRSSLPMLPLSTNTDLGAVDENLSIYLQEDKEQRLMVTILKAKIDAETRAIHPLQKLMRNIQGNKAKRNKGARNHKGQRRRHRRHMTDDRLDKIIDECDQEQQQGLLRRAARLFKRQANRAKQQAGDAVSVARTATVLTAVGMSAGGGSPMASTRFSKSIGRTTKYNSHSQQSDTSSTTNGVSEYTSGNDVQNKEQDSKPTKTNTSCPNDVSNARQGVNMFAHNFFRATAGESDKNIGKDVQPGAVVKGDSLAVRKPRKRTTKFPFKDILMDFLLRSSGTDPDGEKNSLNDEERALVAKIRRKNVDLKLKASCRILKAFTRTNVKVAKKDIHQGNAVRRQRVLANEFESNVPSQTEQLCMKNGRFMVKASLTVLRETARYAGGAFSAAIVCVETMELKEKMKRIRGKGVQCSNAEQLEHLKRHLWENQGSFPDTTMLERELSADSKEENRVRNCLEDEKKECSMIPHWSSSYEGERPDGSWSNLPVMKDSSSF